MEITVCCPECGAYNKESVLQYKDALLIYNEGEVMLICSQCQHEFVIHFNVTKK
jgi:hypothetical protein